MFAIRGPENFSFVFLLLITDFHLKSVGTQAANLDLSLNELNCKFSRLSTVAASCRGAWERSETVRSICINILPPHLAPVTWPSVSGSRGVRSELLNAISSPRPTPVPQHAAHLEADARPCCHRGCCHRVGSWNESFPSED